MTVGRRPPRRLDSAEGQALAAISNRPLDETRACAHCGGPFHPIASCLDRHRFCSNACARRAKRLTHRAQEVKE